jgi:photosystem II stability/assembly factor-like uncharacterized protein
MNRRSIPYSPFVVAISLSLLTITFCFVSCKKNADFSTRWKKVKSSYSGQLYDFCFLSKDTGYILGAYNYSLGLTVWQKTVDGGETWTTDTLRVGENKSSITTLTSYNHILYAGGTVLGGASPKKRTYSSSDNGVTWKIIDTIYMRGRNMVYLNASNAVFVFVEDIYKSSDGGSTFQHVYASPTHLGYSFIQFPDQLTGFVAGGMAHDGVSVSTMAKTTDGGATWNTINSSLPKIISMQFFNSNSGNVIVYDQKGNVSQITYSDYKLFQTSDGGNTWNIIRDNLKQDFGNITSSYFKDERVGFMTSEQFIYSTNDGGRSWTKEFDAGSVIQNGIILTGLYFTPPGYMFAYSTDGSIYKRTE